MACHREGQVSICPNNKKSMRGPEVWEFMQDWRKRLWTKHFAGLLNSSGLAAEIWT